MTRRSDVVRTEGMTLGPPGARSLGGLPKAWCFKSAAQFNVDFGAGPLPPVEGLLAQGDTSAYLSNAFLANVNVMVRNYEHDLDGVTGSIVGFWVVNNMFLDDGLLVFGFHMEAEETNRWAASCVIPAGGTAGFSLSVPVGWEGECSVSCSFVEVDAQTDFCCDYPPPGG